MPGQAPVWAHLASCSSILENPAGLVRTGHLCLVQPGSVLLLAGGVQGQLWEALPGPMGGYGSGFLPKSKLLSLANNWASK